MSNSNGNGSDFNQSLNHTQYTQWSHDKNNTLTTTAQTHTVVLSQLIIAILATGYM